MQTNWRAVTVAVALAGGAALGAPRPALAQPPAVTAAQKATARRDYKAAEAKFAQGQYAAALKLYEAAEATVPIPQTKYKIAICKDKLGQVPDAIHWYKRFLDSVPPEKAEKLADNMADAKARLSVLEKTPGQVRVVTAPAVGRLLASIDGAPFQQIPPNLGLPPGHHRLVFQADGFAPVATELDVVPADSKEIRLTLVPAPPGAVAAATPGALPPPPGAPPPAVPPPIPPPHRRSNVPAYVLLGAAGAGIVVGSAFGAIALQDKSNFNKNPTNAGADTTHTHALISDVSFGAAAALAVTGIVLLVTNLPQHPGDTASRAFVTPYAGPTGAGAVAGLSF